MIHTLVKINLRALFAGMFRRYKGKKKNKPAMMILIGLLIIYIAGALMFSVGAIFFGISATFFDAGLGWFYFALAGIIVFALCFVSGIFMVQTQIFSARDNELLLSMPIKPSAILAGRLSALLIIEYLFEAVILIPVFVVLIMNNLLSRLPAAGIVFFFIAAALLPLIAIALGCFAGWVIALISSHMRNKNIVTLVLSIAFLAAYFWLYSRMMSNMNMLMTNGSEIADAVRRAVFPAYHLGVAIADGSVASFLIFAVFAIVPFTIMWALLSWSFVRLTTAGRGVKRIEYREKNLRASGSRTALLRRELLYFWSAPMYILNSSLGAIAALALTIVLIVRPGLITGVFSPDAGMLSAIDPGFAGAIVLAALAAMNFVSAPTISLEGKNLWIVKSLPVQTRDVLISKVGLHLTVCGIPSVLAGIACIIALPVNGIAQIVLTFIMPLSVTLMFAFLGITLNLTFPRFDWINPIQPVKQGMSSMLSMFGGMALIIALALVYVLLLSDVLALDIFLSLCTIALVAVSAGLCAYVLNAGCKKFDML